MVEREKITAGECITIGQTTLIPVIRIVAHCRKGSRGITGFGYSDVLGILILSAEGTHAIDVSGKSIPVEHYVELVPGLAEFLQ